MKNLSWTLRRAAAAFAAATCLSVAPRASAQFPPARGTGPGLAETIEAIDSARVTTRILYVTAHPDDESAAVLTYLARGLHADVALLSITRGEGGQNALGPEQAPQLGLIRTQELLAATRGYGVKLFFTRAKDFGYSKTPEETMKVWGDQVLEDMVRVIRTFRPNIVINHWGGVHGGHGHHQAAGILTPKAVQMAAEGTAFSTQLKDPLNSGLAPWHVSLLLELERGESKEGLALPLDDVSPFYGKTYREIGLDAFINHRTQGISGFINSPFLLRPISLKSPEHLHFGTSMLAQPLESVAGSNSPRALRDAEKDLRQADEAVQKRDWETAVAALAESAALVRQASNIRVVPCIDNCGSDPLYLYRDAQATLLQTQSKVNEALELVGGVQISAKSDRSWLIPGESFLVSVSSRCRPGVNCKFEDLRLAVPQGWQVKTEDSTNTTGNMRVTPDISNPPPRQLDQLQPEPTPLVVVEQDVTLGGYKLIVREPVTYLNATSTRVDRVPLRIVPAYTLAVEPKQDIEMLAKQRKPFDVLLRVHSYATQPGKVTVGLDVPQGWTSSVPVTAEFTGVGDQYAKLTVTPPDKIALGNYTIAAYAKRGDEKFTTSLEPLPSLPTQFWSEPAQCIVHAFDVNVPENLRVGYVTAEGEPIPEALRRLGIQVETLDAQALAFSDLSKYDAVVVGVRGYELRPELPGANQRLLDYVSNGGTLVVQYNRDSVWDKLQPGPYPAKIGSPTPRITDENSPVKFLKPDDALLNRPNKITQDDFKGWVQERGLYFWSQFDAKYTPLLAMNDPGESDLSGALVYTHYGKGTYIYTGIAFFRQLPEGVPAAYRLFVNLLSASRGR
jgi:LmbE family N-acetylglucosaminyl deacetylase